MAEKPSEQSIFLHAVELASPADRAAYLEDVCRDDPRLRRDVEALLAANERLDADAPPTGPEPPRTRGGLTTERPGSIIGPYKLLQQIGEGGMGTVFMAEQSHPVQRKVALKIIKPGLDSRQILARFQAERQALALMDHPNIAKVLDAGATGGEPGDVSAGRPYFVMELVKGVPITRYCDEHHLTPRERLELFVPVCQAIQHAHGKGIIHRDIKPSNVMVCTYDGKPTPKVIDFGVAKATGPKLTEQTLFTEFGAIVGTFEYMSPEQAQLDQLDTDTRSDIYSLGVLLYELLTGTTPLERKRMKEVAVLELLRLVREEDPPRPSTRLSTAEALPSIAASRGTEPKKLSRLVRGELDWIVMKCLEKDRDRRYETANGLARDIERHLHDEPVQACPPSAGYKLRKFARKHRTLLGTAAAFVVLLVASAIVSAWLAVQAYQSQVQTLNALGEAQTQRDRARQAVDEMYTGVAEKWLTHQPRLQRVQAEFLQKALAYYEEFAREESNDPEARLRRGLAYKRIGDMQAKLAKHAEAEKAYQSAIEILQPLAEASHTPPFTQELARAHHNLGVLFERVGRPVDAEKACRVALSYQETLAMGSTSQPEYKKDLAVTWRDLGEILLDRGRTKESEDAYRHALKIQQAEDFPTEPDYRNDLAMTLNKLGELIQYHADQPGGQERRGEVGTLFRQALVIADRLEADFPAVPAYRENLGVAANSLASSLPGNVGSERDKLWHRALAAQQRLVADFPDIPEYRFQLATSQINLGFLRLVSGQYKEAEAELKQALPVMEKLVSELPRVPRNQELVAEGLHNLAHSLSGQNRPAEATPLQERALAYIQKALENCPDNPNFRVAMKTIYMNLGKYRAQVGNHVAAARAVQEGIKERPAQDDYANGASTLLLCARSAENDGKLTEEERRSNAREYVQQAITYYRLALKMAEQEAAKSKDPGRFSKPAEIRWSLARALQMAEPSTRVTPWSDSDSWVIKGQELHQLDDNQTVGHTVLFGDLGWADYDLEAEFEVLAGGSEVGLVFRALSPTHLLRAALGAFGNTRHGFLVWDQASGLGIGLVDGQTAKGRWYRVRVEVRGNTFKVFLDGKLLSSASSDKYPRGCAGLVTVRCAARFRNIRITDPTGKVLLEGVKATLPSPDASPAPTGDH